MALIKEDVAKFENKHYPFFYSVYVNGERRRYILEVPPEMRREDVTEGFIQFVHEKEYGPVDYVSID